MKEYYGPPGSEPNGEASTGLMPIYEENQWEIKAQAEAFGGQGKRRRPRRGLKPRPAPQRVGNESLLFDYQGEEKGGAYGAVVPVVAGYLIPGIIIAMIVLALVFVLVGTAIGVNPQDFLAAMESFDPSADAGESFGAEGLTETDLNEIITQYLPYIALIYLLIFAIAIPFLLLFTRQVERRKFRTLGFQGKGKGWQFLLGVAAGTLAALIPFFAAALITRSRITINPAASLHIGWLGPMLLSLAFFCVQGSFEELFFRGWSFTTLGKRFPRWQAAVVSSLVFASLHFALSAESLLSVVNAFSIGMFFCVLSMQTGNIAMACGFHAIWNFLQFNLLNGVSDQGGIFQASADMENDNRYLFIVIAWTALLALLSFAAYQYKVKKEAKPQEAPGGQSF